MTNRTRVGRAGSRLRLIAVALCAMTLAPWCGVVPATCWAQVRAFRGRYTAETNAEPPSATGLRLGADPEQEQLIRRAEQLARDGRFDLAAVLWQRVLDDAGGALMTRDEWQHETLDGEKFRRYRAVAVELQGVIARLPAEGLRMYRASADAEAQALLAAATAETREAALHEVVRRYFLSSLGDDAALELASRSLDRHDFVGAVRLLNQVETLYPQPSVNRAEVLERLVVANARVGDLAASQAALGQLETLPGARPRAELLAVLRAESHRAPVVAANAGRDHWLTRLGNPAGDGHMPRLPATATAAELSDNWNDIIFDAAEPPAAAPPQEMIRRGRRAVVIGGVAGAAPSLSREQMIDHWQKSTWTPTGQMLVYQGRVFYKALDRVTSRDLATGKLAWFSPTTAENNYQPVLPQLFQNAGWQGMMQLRAMQMAQQGGQAPPMQSTPLEVQLLGDRVHPAMSIVGNLLVAIEALPQGASQQNDPQQGMNFADPRSSGASRRRENRLAAYDVTTGVLKWQREDGGPKKDNSQPTRVGFLAAPVPFAQQLLVPILENGTVWLAALDYRTGKILWRSVICEEPDGGCDVWSPAGIAIDGGDVYVVAGAGTVAALDALTGTVHWIAQYPRKAMGADPYRFNGRLTISRPTCWSEDTVIAKGRNLIVMPSDGDEILSFDRRTGELIWKTGISPNRETDSRYKEGTPPIDAIPAAYCLGILNDCLYVAGPEIVRCYRVDGGNLKWEHRLAHSSGRGLLTPDAVYIPDQDCIVRLDPRPAGVKADKRELGRTKVVTTTAEPVGNLYTDGQRLIVQGLSRVYTLDSLEERLARLARRIDNDDFESLRERSRLYQRLGKKDEALADLKAAYASARKNKQAGPIVATELLIGGITELNLPTERPALALGMLVMAERDARQNSAAGSLSPDLARQRSAIISGVLTTAERIRSAVDVPTLVSAAILCHEEYLFDRLRRLIRTPVRPVNMVELQTAATDSDPWVRRAAAAGLGTLRNAESAATLTNLLDDSQERVRLAAAWELADRGQKSSLPALVRLLDSNDPTIRSRSFAALRTLTGQTLDYRAFAEATERAKGLEAWKQWLAKSADTAVLKFPLQDSSARLGRLLMAGMGNNQVTEIDADGKETWSIRVTNPYGVWGTPEGHRLVAAYSTRSIHEYDEKGNEVWSYADLPGHPSSVQRLENGNTLVVLNNTGQAVEISPEKKVLSTQNYGSGTPFALRLDNGNTLVCQPSLSRVAELDSKGTAVATFEAAGASTARRLENGNTLIVEQGRGRVIEVAPGGKTVWTLDQVMGPWDAERLPNGNTVVSHARGVQEFNPAGQPVHTWNFPNVFRLSAF